MSSDAVKRPNIVFVLTDDQGYWALGCNGNRDIITPNIDSIAREGCRFENFFCVSPVCSPARASLLCGAIPSQHGIHDWIREGNTGRDAIEYLHGIRAYTEDLAENGYSCALSGKWHLGDSVNPQKGFNDGWYVHQRGGGDYYNAPMIENGELFEQDGYITDAITDRAIDFIDRLSQGDNPFYLGVHYTAPHSPWTAEHHPQELRELYDGCEFSDCPTVPMHPWSIFSTAPDALTAEDVKKPQETLKGYYAAVTAVDNSVGKIVEKLKSLGIYEDTIIIFTSDNGFNCGHHGIWGKGNGTFPMNMYDSSVKVPFIISHPGKIKSETVVDDMVSGYDFMPTLLDYLKIKTPPRDNLPGRSFAPLLQGDAVKNDRDKTVVVYDEYGPVRMIRSYTDKYVCRYPYGPDEYYDLVNDPGEECNLIDRQEHSERICYLKNTMQGWFIKYVDPQRDGLREGVTGNGQIDMVDHTAKARLHYEPGGFSYSVDT